MVKLHKTGADVGLYAAADCGIHVALFCVRRRRICQYTVFFSLDIILPWVHSHWARARLIQSLAALLCDSMALN
jgi:hypothetical protein